MYKNSEIWNISYSNSKSNTQYSGNGLPSYGRSAEGQKNTWLSNLCENVQSGKLVMKFLPETCQRNSSAMEE